MSDLTNEELIATRRLHGLDDGLFGEKEEIEVGEYVRTKDGIIAQIESIDYEDKVYEFDSAIYTNVFGFTSMSLGNNEMFQKIIVKHSKQLINLIEVGDYVNGKEVIEIRKINEKKYLITSYCPQDYIKTNIKRILTKEQIEANCYEVKGEEKCM